MAEYQNFWKDNSNETLMHCVCKDGFFGPRYVCDYVASLRNSYVDLYFNMLVFW
jgi:hypothetical protein